MIDEDNPNSRNIDPFISIFLDGKYKSIDLVPIKNKVIKFCSEQNINIKLESTPRLLAFWNRPKLVWRILHDQNRTNSNITDEEIKNNKVYDYNLDKLTDKNAKHILLLDLQKADEQLQADYGEKYNKLDKKRKQMLIDLQYNMGSERVKQFKNFKEGLFSNNIEKMKEEYERGFTNKEGEFKKLTNRNKDFFNYFFVDK